MGARIETVHAKARAFVEALARLPHSDTATLPHGHFARDYNKLRRLALEVAPSMDERLLGKYVAVFETSDGEFSRASYVEIEVYARQIMEQLTLLLRTLPPAQGGAAIPTATTAPVKAYNVASIRQEYNQAYAPWSEQDDEYLRTRFREGATIDDLVSEFGRKAGAIKSRLRRLGLEPPRRHSQPETKYSEVESDAGNAAMRTEAGK